MLRSEIIKLRRSFRKTIECGAKQKGLRDLQTALTLLAANPAVAAERVAEARFLLPIAQARTERGY